MGPRLFTVERAGLGALSTMARPLGGDRLAEEMRALALSGVGILVSMLSDGEIAELGLAREAAAAESAGMTFHRLPTPDLNLPDRGAALDLAGALRSHLGEGASIAIHCRAGVGRSSTLAAAVLVLEGLAPAEAWARISAARGLPVPETEEQREFIRMLLPGM